MRPRPLLKSRCGGATKGLWLYWASAAPSEIAQSYRAEVLTPLRKAVPWAGFSLPVTTGSLARVTNPGPRF
jgi:hypothetical protein